MKGTLNIDVDDFIKILGKPDKPDKADGDVTATLKRIETKVDTILRLLTSSQQKLDAAGEAIAENTEKLQDAQK